MEAESGKLFSDSVNEKARFRITLPCGSNVHGVFGTTESIFCNPVMRWATAVSKETGDTTRKVSADMMKETKDEQ